MSGPGYPLSDLCSQSVCRQPYASCGRRSGLMTLSPLDANPDFCS